jgi:hypothetical protein
MMDGSYGQAFGRYGGLHSLGAIRFNWSSLDYLILCVLGSRVFRASVGCKIFVAPPLVVLLHFIERFAGGRS